MESKEQYSHIKVLVVDDDNTTQLLLRSYFNRLGCQTEFAVNGEDAVTAVRERPFDICFMDIDMPIMNGLIATKLIRRDISKELPIVAITGYIQNKDKDVCLEAGMDGFLSKPLYQWDIEDMIKKYVLEK